MSNTNRWPGDEEIRRYCYDKTSFEEILVRQTINWLKSLQDSAPNIGENPVNQQSVLPGIVAFKHKNCRDPYYFKDSTRKGGYEEWVNRELPNPFNTIHTISVDGREWTVGETVIISGVEAVIHGFIYEDNMWKATFGEYCDVYQEKLLSKATPQPENPVKGAGDDTQKIKEFNAALVTLNAELIAENKSKDEEIQRLKEQTMKARMELESFEEAANEEGYQLKKSNESLQKRVRELEKGKFNHDRDDRLL